MCTCHELMILTNRGLYISEPDTGGDVAASVSQPGQSRGDCGQSGDGVCRQPQGKSTRRTGHTSHYAAALS